MPSRFIVKKMMQNSCYHVYNRGVEKRDIFCDERDYKFFLYLLKNYLTKLEDLKKGLNPLPEGSTLQRGRFSDSVDLLAYALMPNHYHLILKQTEANILPEFMKSLANNYVGYFNKRYDRVGTLFQGRYKAILIEDDDYLIHLSRYIHLNPRKRFNPLEDKEEYSSYKEYLGKRNTKWIKPDFILGLFNSTEEMTLGGYKQYKEFVEDFNIDKSEKEYLGKLVIE